MDENKQRAEFEAWLWDDQMLSATWQPERGCYGEFHAHIAFKAWQAARTTPPEPARAQKGEGAADCVLNQLAAEFSEPHREYFGFSILEAIAVLRTTYGGKTQ